MEKEVRDTITYPLVVKKNLWRKFLDTLPKSRTINESLNEIIEREVERHG